MTASPLGSGWKPTVWCTNARCLRPIRPDLKSCPYYHAPQSPRQGAPR